MGRPPASFGRVTAAVICGGFAVLLCLPLLASLTGLRPGEKLNENRVLAAAPEMPRTLATATEFPGRLSAYIADHYGLRDLLVGLDGRLRYRLFGEFASDQLQLGLNKRVFFTSYLPGAPFSLTDDICGISTDTAQTEATARGIAGLLDSARRITPHAHLLFVPTAPIIDHADMPRWMAQRCDATEPYVPQIARALARLRPDIADRLLYPKPALEAVATPFPPWNFHWSGVGARAVVEFVSSHDFSLPRRRAFIDAQVVVPSDLAQFTPGIVHDDVVPLPDQARAGVSFCAGAGGACDPALAAFAPGINEIAESRWQSGRGPSLLIISDSFGHMAAEYFGEYFADILQLNISFERLRPEDMAALAAAIAARGRPDELLFLYHDGAAVFLNVIYGPIATLAAAFPH